MILGLWQNGHPGKELHAELFEGLTRAWGGTVPEEVALWSDEGLAMCWLPEGLATMDRGPQPFISSDGDITLIFQGKIYNGEELEKNLAEAKKGATGSPEQILVRLYQKNGPGFLDGVNGKFAIALWDRRTKTLWLGRDRLGIEPLYYGVRGDRLMFATSLRRLVNLGLVARELNEQVLLQYLLFCYNPDQQTFWRDVSKLPAAHFMRADPEGIAVRKYWRLSFAEQQIKSERQYAEEILEIIEDAIRIRTEPDQSPGIFLSGGTDSSTLVSLTSRIYDRPLSTFSFRCRGKSFDESSWAQFVAERFGADHTLVSFDPQDALLIEELVRSMDEPFCDIGIEIGTYLLGRAAAGKVDYVFSGEGGDEAFGGHPVYQADKMAALVDWIPQFLLRPLSESLQRLPDSDQKKNLQVKAKRFAYSLAFPRDLLSHRWRTYYTLAELNRLCSDDFLRRCDLEERYAGIMGHHQDTDGRDALSRSLYSDYWTLVDFYLRRLQLLRTFSVESRLPLLDYRLVEYAATVPSRLKVRRFGETKYLYKKILEDVIPDEILYGRPKLGHSVPLKNWLREDQGVRGFLMEHLVGGLLLEKGLLRREAIGRMVDEHTGKIENHSHRLWALLVLELWMRANVDR